MSEYPCSPGKAPSISGGSADSCVTPETGPTPPNPTAPPAITKTPSTPATPQMVLHRKATALNTAIFKLGTKGRVADFAAKKPRLLHQL